MGHQLHQLYLFKVAQQCPNLECSIQSRLKVLGIVEIPSFKECFSKKNPYISLKLMADP
jgi:hypothetical protein